MYCLGFYRRRDGQPATSARRDHPTFRRIEASGAALCCFKFSPHTSAISGISVLIRLANRSDAPLWIELLRATVGVEYPAKEVYDLNWVAAELGAGDERETWIAEDQGAFLASIAFHELAQREPHLGLAVMRNIAVELSAKLRKTNAVWIADRKS